MEEQIFTEVNSKGNSSPRLQEEIRVKDVTLGKWPFARDPESATAIATDTDTKIMGESSVKKDPRALFFASPTSVILGMKRKFGTLDSLGKSKLDAASATNNNLAKKFYCSICKQSATSEKALHDHLQGKKHKNKEVSCKFNDPKNIISIDSNSNRAYCSVCEVHIPSEKRVKVHLEGKKHRAKANKVTNPGQIENGVNGVNGVNVENDDLGFLSDEELVSGKRPEKQENTQEIVEGEIAKEKSSHCENCNVTYSDEQGMYCQLCNVLSDDHMQSRKHSSILEDKSGIVIISATEEAGKEVVTQDSQMMNSDSISDLP